MSIHEAIIGKTLDEKGRCCGRKPLVYRGRYTLGGPHRFCPRCDRAYHLIDNEQIPNWAWQYSVKDGLTRRAPEVRQ